MFAALFLPVVAAGLAMANLLPNDPPIELWINNDRRFFPGEEVEVHVRTDADGYLVVFHADPDGHVHVLFPLDPGDDNLVHGGKRYEIRNRGDRKAFEASIAGRGTVYAAVSRDPFDFARYASGGQWDYQTLAPDRLPREPEAELTELVRGMARSSFDYDVLTYDVIERVYAADDHSYQPSYSYWAVGASCDPFYYHYSCRPYYGYYGYGSYLSVSLAFGTPYYPYYYPYTSYYYPYYYRPVYGYPHRYYAYNPYRYSPHRPYYGPVPVGGVGGFGGYRDRRYTFAGVNGNRRQLLASATPMATPVRRPADRAGLGAGAAAPADRRAVDRRPMAQGTTEARSTERPYGRRPVEPGVIEAHRAREAEPRSRPQPNIQSRPAPTREPEARRVAQRGDNMQGGDRGSGSEARPGRRDAVPREDGPREDAPRYNGPRDDTPRAAPRSESGRRGGGDYDGGRDRGAGPERRGGGGGGGESRPSRSGGGGGGSRGGGWGGGGRR